VRLGQQLFGEQVHEEVLRLILVAAPQLSVPQVAQYLQNTINNSKRSRRCPPTPPLQLVIPPTLP